MSGKNNIKNLKEIALGFYQLILIEMYYPIGEHSLIMFEKSQINHNFIFYFC